MEQAVLQKWEYQVDEVETNTVTDSLNLRGEDGWELVNVVREPDPTPTGPAKTMRARREKTVHLFFKRPKGF